MKIFLLVFLATILADNVQAEDFLELSSSELIQVKASRPYFVRNVGRVTVESKYGHSEGFRNALKNLLFSSGAFDSDASDKLKVNATFLEFNRDNADGAFERSYFVKVKYDLLDGEKVVGSWTIGTHGSSNVLMAENRDGDALETTLKRNLRSFLLNLKSSFDPEDSEKARLALVEIGSESDSNGLRSIVGFLVLGTGSAVKATGSAVGAMAGAMASPEFQQNLSNFSAELNENNKKTTELYQHALNGTRPLTKGEIEAAQMAAETANRRDHPERNSDDHPSTNQHRSTPSQSQSSLKISISSSPNNQAAASSEIPSEPYVRYTTEYASNGMERCRQAELDWNQARNGTSRAHLSDCVRGELGFSESGSSTSGQQAACSQIMEFHQKRAGEYHQGWISRDYGCDCNEMTEHSPDRNRYGGMCTRYVLIDYYRPASQAGGRAQ